MIETIRDALRSSFSLFTLLPVGAPDQFDQRRVTRAMLAAPFVGLVLGVIADVFVLFFRIFGPDVRFSAPTLLPAVVGIAVLTLLTRALHLDGLADVADSHGAGPDRERALTIMRDSRIGTYGTLALIFAVLLQVSALSVAITDHRGTVTLIVASMSGRLAATWACVNTRPARPNGLGAMVAGSVRTGQAVALTVAVFAVSALAGLLDIDGGAPSRAVRAVITSAVGLAVGYLAARIYERRFGGITGDVLGTVVEITVTVVVLGMALTPPNRLVDLIGH
jgi:adenosylcobinamide-GDP ribazoletransferase